MPQTKALIVDDSVSARFALTRALEPFQLDLTAAKTGEEALETAAAGRFDVIFMDHVLPGLSGLDTVEKIRVINGYEYTPIIMCSSNDSPEYQQEAHQRGANAVLGKPPEPAALAQVMDELLKPVLAEAATAPAPTSPEPPTPTVEESPAVSDTESLRAIDERIARLESMLQRLEQTVEALDAKSQAMAKAVADQAGRDLSNRLLRAVLTLKGGK